MCTEATLRISLNSYLYLKLVKCYLSCYLLHFLFNKIRKQESGTGSARKQCVWGVMRSGEVAKTMYTHVSKWTNYKKNCEKQISAVYVLLYLW
jgi:hypothetical protein